jgi:hypothetical protein
MREFSFHPHRYRWIKVRRFSEPPEVNGLAMVELADVSRWIQVIGALA